MLPAVHPLTADDATRWARAAVPHWVPRWLLLLGWLACTVTELVNRGDTCSPAEPSICGPDQGWAWGSVVWLATPVLLVWLAPLGCLAGALLAAGDLLLDGNQQDHPVFAAYGLVCCGAGLWMLLAVGRQRRLIAAVTGSLTTPVPPSGAPRRDSARLVAVAALVLVAAGLFGWYTLRTDAEQSHLGRAVRVDARLAGANRDADRIVLELPGGRRAAVEVGSTDGYPAHGSTPVLLDPADPGWLRPVGEPLDETIWQSGGIGAALLALLLLWRDLDRRRGLRRLLDGPQPAVRVRLVRGDFDGVLVLAQGKPTVPVARLEVTDPVWPDGPTAGPGVLGEGTEPVPAVLAGDLRDRGWALLITAEGTLLPCGPLAVRRWPPAAAGPVALLARFPLAGAWRPWSRQTAERELPGEAIGTGTLREPPELPLLARPPRGDRLLGLAAAACGLLGGPVAVLATGGGWSRRLFFAAIAGQLLSWGGSRASLEFRLSAERLQVRTAARITELPWQRLAGVRRDGTRLLPTWSGNKDSSYGPFQLPDQDRTPEDAAEQLGELMLLLRAQARDDGGTTEQVSTRRGPFWAVGWLYLLAVAAALTSRVVL